MRTVYIWLGQVIYWISAPLLFLISLRAQPRVRVILVDDRGCILLVKNWYGRQRWAFPGGGVKRHEPPMHAAQRELREELSLDLAEESLEPIGAIERYDAATPFRVNVFSAELPSASVVHRHPLELIDHRWVLPSELPEPLHPSVQKALKLWRPLGKL